MEFCVPSTDVGQNWLPRFISCKLLYNSSIICWVTWSSWERKQLSGIGTGDLNLARICLRNAISAPYVLWWKVESNNREHSCNSWMLIAPERADYFTKWCEIAPILSQEASTIGTAIPEQWIARSGVPSMVHSDWGVALDSRLLLEVRRKLRIHNTRTTLYHP